MLSLTSGASYSKDFQRKFEISNIGNSDVISFFEDGQVSYKETATITLGFEFDKQLVLQLKIQNRLDLTLGGPSITMILKLS